MTNKKHKFAAALVSGLVVFSAFAATPVGAATVDELTAQINSLLATIAALQAQVSAVSSGTSGSSIGAYTFTRNLKQGDTGADVMSLQKSLNSDAATRVASFGAGSPGNETSTFGPATKAAVVKFQNKYASEVLAPFGLTSGTGFVGSGTRAKLNKMGGSTTSTTPTTPTTPVVTVPMGSGLTVTAAAMQPSAQLVPLKAARVPFTKVTFTASADGDVTVNSVVVERTGQSVDATLDSIVLLDETGMQVGLSKTLNSQHQVILTAPFAVKAGQSRTMTLAANRPSSTTAAHAGMVAVLSLVQVNTSATVNGSFPISGTSQTINEGLTIGSATVNRGSLDPGVSVTKEVGITGYTFSSVRVTAGSGENLRLRSIRFNQTESASVSDLANIMIYVDGTAYTPTITDNGQYFVASFGNGLLIEKGFSKEISIKGDVIGGSGRKVDFDIAKRTDIDLLGELYGYGIMPDFGSSSTADDAQVHAADDYYYDAAVLTIDVGSMNVSVSNATPAQNIAINTANQPFGSFTVDVKGEAISVGRLAFNVTLTGEGSGDDVDLLTNVTLVDENGSVVAGPVDGSATDSSYTSGLGEGSLVFSDSVTFPVGQHTYKLLGKVGTAMDNSTTITASTTPNNDFATVRGLTTGKTITPAPASALTMSVMTVKSGALALSAQSVPIAQTVIAGTKQFEFARYVLDATASGEDIRVTTLPLYFDKDANGTRTDLTNCQLRDGSPTGTSLTTGSNTKNPATTDTASSTSFTFDGNGVTVAKGTAKTLSLTCDVRTGVTSDYWWGIDGAISTSADTYTGATGLVSAQTIVETTTDSNGQRMTASSGGTLTVAIDDASPSYRIVAAGTTGVELARIKFSAANEDVDIRQVALQLSGVASNTPIDLVLQQVTLYDGTTGNFVATAGFNTSDFATSSTIASGAFRVARNASRVLVVKGDLASISSAGPLTASGDLLAVNYDGNNILTTTYNGGNYGVGISSGTNVPGGNSDTASAGVRIMRVYPTVEAIALSTAEKTLSAGTTSDKPIYKFKVTAAGGSQGDSVGLYKFSFEIGSSTLAATTSLFSLYAYTDSGFSNIDTTFSSTGLVNAGQCFNGLKSTAAGPANGSSYPIEIYPDKTACNTATTTYKVPTGTTRYFQLRATVDGVESGTTNIDSFTVRLAGDTAFPVNANTLMEAASGVDGDTNDDFLWSPQSTSTSPTINDRDFTNGYQVQGLPDVGTTQESIQSN